MPEIRALLVYEATVGNQLCGTAPAELATTPHATRLAALSDMAEELTAGLLRGCANWNTPLFCSTWGVFLATSHG